MQIQCPVDDQKDHLFLITEAIASLIGLLLLLQVASLFLILKTVGLQLS